jgi:hypothetical protein
MLALHEDHPGARNPVGALAVDEVPEAVERRKRLRALVSREPRRRKSREQRVTASRKEC